MLIFIPAFVATAKQFFKLSFFIIAILCAFSFGAGALQAQTTYYVDATQGDNINLPCTSPDLPCQTIKAALDQVSSGDTVKIAPSANPYDESLSIPVGGITIEGMGANAAEVEVSQGLTNTMDDVTVRNLSIQNSSERGVLNSGNLTLEKVIVTGHSPHCGGGISALKAVRPRGFPQTDATTLIIKDSTITGSSTENNGGGICARSKTTIQIINSVISGNHAAGSGDPATADYTGMGGAIYVWGGQVYLYNSTVVGNEAANTGGAFFVLQNVGYDFKMYNSLVADNRAAGLMQNCDMDSNILGGAYNLEDTLSCDNPNDLSIFSVNGDPLLDDLDFNGGATLGHALLLGSPAIDAGDPDGCKGPGGEALDQDQRGHQRVGRCDIGSMEFVPAGWVPPVSNPPQPNDPSSPQDPQTGPTGGDTNPLPTNSTDFDQRDSVVGPTGQGGDLIDSQSPGSQAGGCSLGSTTPSSAWALLLGSLLLGLGLRSRHS